MSPDDALPGVVLVADGSRSGFAAGRLYLVYRASNGLPIVYCDGAKKWYLSMMKSTTAATPVMYGFKKYETIRAH